MKKILILLVFVAGCGNLTWTPTAEEWTAMTPEQRNAWSANELRAREANRDYWLRVQESIPEHEVIMIPTAPSTDWQEKRARQEYWQNLW